MLDNVEVFCHSSIKISKDRIVYFDPYNIDKEYKDADIIFITHDHFDHYDINSILKIRNDNTHIVVPFSLKDEVVKYFDDEHIHLVEPQNEYNVYGINFSTIWAYNIGSDFHPKENKWVGYLVNIAGYKYYVMGDTSETIESKCVKCDVLFVPIGGKFTMDRNDAVHLTNIVGPKIAVPIHYGSIVGTKEDAEYFIKNIDKSIEGIILIK